MKIHKIKVLESERFPGEFEIDFTDENGIPYSEVIIAGENGVGKTAILSLINQSLNWTELSRSSHDDRTFIEAKYEVHVSFSNKEILTFQESNSPALNAVFKVGEANENEIYLLEIDTLNDPHQRQSLFHALDNGKKVAHRHHSIQGRNDIDWSGYVRSLFMLPEIQFSGEPVRETRSSLLDSKTGNNKFLGRETQSIKQLIVDVAIGDASTTDQELKAFRNNPNLRDDSVLFMARYDELDKSSRISRFRNAFNTFFDDLKFVGVSNQNPNYPGEYTIQFENSYATFDIEGLSSGEKQIVYRGAFLMRDAGARRSVIALIDEPEISLHPAWQRKIVKYYSQIINDRGNSSNQIFIATHSPYVMQGAENACFFVVKKSKDNSTKSISIEKNEQFDNWSPDQLSLEAFELDTLHSGKVVDKIKEFDEMISKYESDKNSIEDSDYFKLEQNLRKLLRSEDSNLLAADLLEMSNRINRLKK